MSFRQRLTQFLQSSRASYLVGSSGLALLSAASLLALLPDSSPAALAGFLGGVGSNVLAGLLQQFFEKVRDLPGPQQQERLQELAEILSPHIENQPQLRTELGNFLNQQDSFAIVKAVAEGDPAAHGWLLIHIYDDLVQYRQDFDQIHDKLADIEQSQKRIEALIGPLPPTFPIINLPPANSHFSGRKQLLKDLRKAFKNREVTIAITQAITGLGGVGKTQLALEFAHRHRHNYDLIWWLNATDATQLDSNLRILGQRLRLPLPPDDLPSARQMVLSWLSSTNKRWLLIYDNVDSLTPRELHPYRPGGLGHALITSRNPHWQAQARVLDINVFTPQEAADFFQQRLGLADEPSLGQLAEELGYLPLALEHAAAYIETRQTTAAIYLDLFQTRRQELWARIGPPDAYHATITTTWNIGFDQVRQVPGAAELLALCCFLAPDDIPLQALAGSIAQVDLLADCGLPDDLVRADALAVLRQYALLSGTENSVSIHRLVQAVYRDQMGEEKATTWLAVAVDLLLNLWPDQSRLHEWGLGQRILLQLVVVNNLAHDLAGETERAAYLANQTGYYLHFLANYAAARPYLERALAIREKVLGAEHPDTATSLNNLGLLLQATGEYDAARPYLERALAIWVKVLGVGHPNTAQSLNNLGMLLHSTGEYDAARPYLELALAIWVKVMGAEHPDTATSLNNLGMLLQTTGEYDAARPYLERALAIWVKVMGADHPYTAQSLNNLGMLLHSTASMTPPDPTSNAPWPSGRKCWGPTIPIPPPASTTWVCCSRPPASMTPQTLPRTCPGHLGESAGGRPSQYRPKPQQPGHVAPLHRRV
jgi:tetratricopeptide (TPR) repeat protein